MDEWILNEADLKRYPHFDRPMSVENILKVVRNPDLVSRNAFFPFLSYEEAWQPFRDKGDRPSRKSRPIRYACRRDAYIFAYYRHQLASLYEAKLQELGIAHCPIAYRKIAKSGAGTRGKCNIDYANDAFNIISRFSHCSAIALDISSFFDSLDHELIRKIWCELLEVDKLPSDHQAVYNAITRYSFVSRQAVYERLGYYGEKVENGRPRNGYLVPYKDMPIQLCSSTDFRRKICGEDPSFSSLIIKNKKNYGIPQGAPISDLIANFYLIHFDKLMYDALTLLEGEYFRYSDDILMIVPGDRRDAMIVKEFAETRIRDFGEQIFIKSTKTSVVEYSQDNDQRIFELVDGLQGRNGLEYLGFRYDGRNVYIKDRMLAGLYRRMKAAAKAEAWRLASRYQGKSYEELRRRFNYSEFMQRFGRVEDFSYESERSKWTFWTYVVRAVRCFGPKGYSINRQLAGFSKKLKSYVDSELEWAAAYHQKKLRSRDEDFIGKGHQKPENTELVESRELSR